MTNEIDISGVRILYLDDDIFDCRMLSVLLKNTGAVVHTVLTAEDLYKKIESEGYDIIMIDHMMPEYDGITVLQQLRDRHLCDNTPVIAITGNNLASAKSNYIEMGFDEYVAKPIRKNKLLNAIAECLGIKPDVDDNDRRPHILVVDDNELNLMLVENILSEEYRISTALSASDALDTLKTDLADMILLDLHMPGISGYEFIEIIKKDEQLKDIPIICLTSDNGSDAELKCFVMGVMDFITKPFVAEIMRMRVSRILELDRLQNELKYEVEKQTIKLREHSRRFERLTTQIMLTLASTIDAKDKYTNGHSVRVAEYSKMIAKQLNLSRQVQDDIYYMGLIHDIGKIGVPDEIINKTSRLTDEEYAIIKTHTTIGGEILEKMSEMPDIALGARYHHERFDGKGYPEGLKGEQIPMVARIIGVADAYDAMTSNRSYRKALPQEVVRSEIVKGIGTQFDPIFAEVMLKIIDDDTEYVLKER